MFPKIHSNRDPRATISGELRKEFAFYIDRMAKKAHGIIIKYPRQSFAIMVASILISGILAFTVMRQGQAKPLPAIPQVSAQATAGIGQIMTMTSGLETLLALRASVDSLLKKDKLTAKDSLTLKKALETITVVQKQLRQQAPLKQNKP